MNKKELAQKIAEQTNVTPGEAADELDQAIHDVLNNLRGRRRRSPTALQRLIEEAKAPRVPKRRNAKS
jgi:nucleoid DNA-binding protein